MEVGFVSLEPGRRGAFDPYDQATDWAKEIKHTYYSPRVQPGHRARYQTRPQGPSESGVGSSSCFISTVIVNMVGGYVGTSRWAAASGVDMVGGKVGTSRLAAA